MTNAEKELEQLFYKTSIENIDVMVFQNSITGYEIAFWKRKREIAIQPMVSIKLLQAIHNKANELWEVTKWQTKINI